MIRLFYIFLFVFAGSVSLADTMTPMALRLTPGQDLRQEIEAFVGKNQLQAGAILTCVGSLSQVQIRFANQAKGTLLTGHFEIVSLVGTVFAKGGSHLHVSVSDKTGKTYGGHLLKGSKVYTTAEIVLGSFSGINFLRKKDPATGYNELSIEKQKPQ